MSLSNPSTAHFAAAYALMVFTVRPFSKSSTDTENWQLLFGKEMRIYTIAAITVF